MIRHVFYILLISFTILGSILAYRLGVFKSVHIEIKNHAQFYLLYKEHIGPYHKIVPVIEEVETWSKANGIICKKSFGQFLDDPEKTESARLRSHAGCLLQKKEFAEITAEKSLKLKLPDGFKVKSAQINHHIYAEFSGSPGVGVWKVYRPVFELMNKRRFKKQSPIYEVYEILSKDKMNTQYYFPFK